MAIDTQALALVGARTRLAELRSEIDELLQAFPALKGKAAATVPANRKGRRLSEATKQKMRAAWARRKAAGAPSEATKAPPAARKRRKLSAAGRAAIAAAQKKRWAAIKKAKK